MPVWLYFLRRRSLNMAASQPVTLMKKAASVIGCSHATFKACGGGRCATSCFHQGQPGPPSSLPTGQTVERLLQEAETIVLSQEVQQMVLPYCEPLHCTTLTKTTLSQKAFWAVYLNSMANHVHMLYKSFFFLMFFTPKFSCYKVLNFITGNFLKNVLILFVSLLYCICTI